ncbi:unnamed protein product [Boreogadus saida]
MDVFICETSNSHITPQGPTAARSSLGSAQCGRAEVRPSPQLFEESAAAAALYSLSPRGADEWETGPAMHHRPTVSYENILDDGGPSVVPPSPAAERWSPNGGQFPVARDRAFPFVPEEKNKSESDCVGNDGDGLR